MVKMDKKFYGEIMKVKNGSVVPDDEYVVFLAKDTAFAATLPTYLEKCKELGADEIQIKLVEELIARVAVWRAEHLDRLKVPDAEGEVVLQ